ncbi:Ribosomal protein L24E [Halorhabdus utahensis DSM 12940]|uniref:Large ribosomal subunit protein eL24 n=1 Tax=Halorhabdus utahensis (strain DSM 12940 / JCM 11049 / AX-2) TaxID=519442 RepID=C7NTU8_HALUD|nr:50S ribosomal protein L24e [Halorhabdus utahensis]ACV10937.1 Ribosomal protein L24E [Halorhabdus utahensis DSM 12940]
MPQTRECDYCGADIEPGTGTMFVRKNGTTIHFCSSKCEKNADLGREARDLSWTEAGRGTGGDAAAEQQTDTADADEQAETENEDEAAEDAAAADDADEAEDEVEADEAEDEVDADDESDAEADADAEETDTEEPTEADA